MIRVIVGLLLTSCAVIGQGDDTADLQSRIDATASTETLVLEARTYRLAGTVHVEGRRGITIQGVAGTVLAGSAAQLLRIENCKDVTLRGIRFEAAAQADRLESLVAAYESRGVLFEHCTFEGGAVASVAAFRCHDLQVRGCEFLDASDAIYLWRCKDVELLANHFEAQATELRIEEGDPPEAENNRRALREWTPTGCVPLDPPFFIAMHESDDGPLPANLRALHWYGMPAKRSSEFAALTSLERLAWPVGEGFEIADLRVLESLPMLRSLRLDLTVWTEGGEPAVPLNGEEIARRLQPLQRLESLSLVDYGEGDFDDTAVALLAGGSTEERPPLKELLVYSHALPVSGEGLSSIVRFNGLQRLSLIGLGSLPLTAQGIHSLIELDELISLQLWAAEDAFAPMDQSWLEALGAMSRIERVVLVGWSVSTPLDWSPLARLPGLQELELRLRPVAGTPGGLDEESVWQFAEMKRLKHLKLDGWRIGADSEALLAAIGSMDALESLELTAIDRTMPLAALGSMPHLRELEIIAPLSQEQLDALQPTICGPRMQVLRLRDVAGLHTRHLQAWSNLSELHLVACDVADVDFTRLREFSNLMWLTVEACANDDRRGTAELKAARRGLVVYP